MLFGHFNKRQIKQDFIDYYGRMLVSETGNDIVSLIRYSLGVVSPLDVTHADLCERVNIDWKAIQRFTPSPSPNIWAGYTFAWSTVPPKSSEEAENACTIGTRSLNYSSRTDTSNKASNENEILNWKSNLIFLWNYNRGLYLVNIAALHKGPINRISWSGSLTKRTFIARYCVSLTLINTCAFTCRV